ncbi:hypothetical protein [Spirosoma sp. KNUC1025]|uniref:hypothetical protein n=1 Tax=Spirosoma sp. KNUC1025 TaxID=2894082 RepID=UPI00386EF14D|nr:hypothetical protein LN737_01165 [Spirosoma sp. KNUC1025]
MNPRNISEKFDDGVMGEIASVAVIQFLMDHGRNVIAYDDIRKDQYQEPDPGWDILSSRQSFDDWLDHTADVKSKPDFAYSFSIKSSRIPAADGDDINLAIRRRDFKIFKRSTSIELDITSDFEVQVYYSLQSSKFDNFLSITLEDISNKRIDAIVEKLKLLERYSECFLSGAASRSRIIEYSNSLPESKKYWGSYHEGHQKFMWSAPLSLGVSFENITN